VLIRKGRAVVPLIPVAHDSLIRPAGGLRPAGYGSVPPWP
jgi:hypothetical protein